MAVTISGFYGDQIFTLMSPIHLFPWYPTREDYKAKTGKDAPAFNPSRRPKYWEDVDIMNRNGGRPTVTYDVICTDPSSGNLCFLDGKPFLDKMTITTAEAETVNIPPKKAGIPDVVDPATDKPFQGAVRMPCRDLRFDEYLEWEAFGGVAVKVKEKPVQPHDQVVQALDALAARQTAIESQLAAILDLLRTKA